MTDLNRLDLTVLGILIDAQKYAAKEQREGSSSKDISAVLPRNAEAKRVLKSHRIDHNRLLMAKEESADSFIHRMLAYAKPSETVCIEHMIMDMLDDKTDQVAIDRLKTSIELIGRHESDVSQTIVFDSFKLAKSLGSRSSEPEHLILLLLREASPTLIKGLNVCEIDSPQFEHSLTTELRKLPPCDEKSFLEKAFRLLMPGAMPTPSKRMYPLIRTLSEKSEVASSDILIGYCNLDDQKIVEEACWKCNAEWTKLRAAILEILSH